MKKPIKKILVVRMLPNMVKALVGQRLTVLAYDFESDPIIFESKNINNNQSLLPRDFPNRSFKDIFLYPFKLSKIINIEKPNIVHINSLQDILIVFLATKFCSLKGFKPSIVAMSHNPHSWSDYRKIKISLFLIKYFTDGFVALSNTHKEKLVLLGHSANRIKVIPNPYDPILLTNQMKIASKKIKNKKTPIIITYIANICSRKAQDVLISAAALVLKKHPDVSINLIGKIISGEEEYARKINNQIHELGISNSVQTIGEVPHSEIQSFLDNTDIFVFPSLSEMMPRAVIEAMMSGIPVIASGTDGILDLIKNRETGLLVQPGDSFELSDKICELIENPEYANKLGISGQKFIQAFCSPERIGELYLEFYEYVYNSR